MPRVTHGPSPKSVEALRHQEATRRTIATAEYQRVVRKAEQDPVRVAYERRNRDLEPRSVRCWRRCTRPSGTCWT